jgi:catechol 2,3-dioxygenase-like lactoylglutathione lyase family enzyme
MRVEGLQPARTDEFDFLRRFLDRLGAGPHHITFKVPDLDDMLARLAADDIQPARVDRSEADWQEAFLFPADAGGIVVQLAQAGDGEPDDLGGGPPPSTAAPAWLDHLALAVADQAATRNLFEGVLGGVPVADGADGEGPWVELAWPGPGRLRLVAAEGPAAAWIGGRTGRLHHVAFTVEDPARIGGATEREDGSFEVPPEANLGVRLRLAPAS